MATHFQKGHLAETPPGNIPEYADTYAREHAENDAGHAPKHTPGITPDMRRNICRTYFKTSVIPLWLYIPVGVGPTEVFAPSGFLPMHHMHGRQKYAETY